MSWFNGGDYQGIPVYELRHVLAEFCTAVNERQFALNRTLTQWGTYEGVTIPTYPDYTDFNGVPVGSIGWIIGLIQYSLVGRSKYYGFGGDINPPFVGQAYIPLINTYDYPAYFTATSMNRFVADEIGTPLDPLAIVTAAGYGDDWLPVSTAIGYGSQDLSSATSSSVATADPSVYDNIRHTNYRIYDQIRQVIDQLFFIQGKVWLSPVAYSIRGQEVNNSTDTQEAVWDLAVADMGNPLASGPGLCGRQMQAGTFSRDCYIKNNGRLNLNFGVLRAGTFHRHEMYMMGFAGDNPFNPGDSFDNVYAADAFTVTDSDGDTYVVDVAETGTQDFTVVKAESVWASSPHVIEFEMPLPSTNPFAAIPLDPVAPPSETNGAIRALSWYSALTEHGLYTRELSVGNGLTYG